MVDGEARTGGWQGVKQVEAPQPNDFNTNSGSACAVESQRKEAILVIPHGRPDHATRRQTRLYRQAEAPGQALRGKLSRTRHVRRRSRKTRLGHGQQGRRRRQPIGISTQQPFGKLLNRIEAGNTCRCAQQQQRAEGPTNRYNARPSFHADLPLAAVDASRIPCQTRRPMSRQP